MVPFYGDYNTTETVVIPFNTFTSDDPTASATITNLVAGDIEIHKNGSATQRASDSGVSVAIDFDSVTGNHMISIDLSDDADSGFYAAGSRYQVRIEGATVDGGTINAWVGSFSIGCTLRPSIDGRTLGVGADGDLLEVNTLTGNTVQTGDAYSAVLGLNNPTLNEIATAVLSYVIPDLSAGDLDVGQDITVSKALRGAISRFYREVIQTGSTQTVKNDSGTVIATMSTSEVVGTSQTKGAAT